MKTTKTNRNQPKNNVNPKYPIHNIAYERIIIKKLTREQVTIHNTRTIPLKQQLKNMCAQTFNRKQCVLLAGGTQAIILHGSLFSIRFDSIQPINILSLRIRFHSIPLLPLRN